MDAAYWCGIYVSQLCYNMCISCDVNDLFAQQVSELQAVQKLGWLAVYNGVMMNYTEAH